MCCNKKWVHLISRLYSRLLGKISRQLSWTSRLISVLSVFFYGSNCYLSSTHVFYSFGAVLFILMEFALD